MKADYARLVRLRNAADKAGKDEVVAKLDAQLAKLKAAHAKVVAKIKFRGGHRPRGVRRSCGRPAPPSGSEAPAAAGASSLSGRRHTGSMARPLTPAEALDWVFAQPRTAKLGIVTSNT